MSTAEIKPIVLLIGPHRSGTSLLTQIVSVLGFDLGKTLMLPSFDNPRGFWENQKIVEIHDKLISSFGKDWTTITSLHDGWLDDPKTKEATEQILEALKTDFRPKEPWLIKDPRLCMLFPIWEKIGKALNRPIKLVTIVRSPQASSQSIQIRNRLSPEDADVIALSYIQAMNRELKSVIDKTFVYENLIKLNGKEIIHLVQEALKPVKTFSDENIENQIERLIFDNTDKDVEKTRIHEIYTNAVGNSPIVTKQALSELVSSLVDAPIRKAIKKAGDQVTLLDLSQQPVSLTQAELDAYELAARESDVLRRKLDEKSKKIRSLKEGEAEAITLLRDELGRVSGGIIERDKLIAESKLEISELQNLFDVKMLDSLQERKKLTERQNELEQSIQRYKAKLAASKKVLATLKGIVERDKLIADLKSETSELQNLFDAKMLDSLNERKKLIDRQNKIESYLKSSNRKKDCAKNSRNL